MQNELMNMVLDSEDFATNNYIAMLGCVSLSNHLVKKVLVAY